MMDFAVAVSSVMLLALLLSYIFAERHFPTDEMH